MTIRIKCRETTEGVIVELHGWLNEEVLGELDNLCGSTPRPLFLDLSNLAGVDKAGLRALRSRAAAGARLEGASPYIQLLLDGEA